MIRRILSIGLTFVFLYNLLGYYPVFEIRQYALQSYIQKVVHQSIPGDQLERLVFTPAAFPMLNWVEKDREFRYAGQLYDIVRIEKAPGRIVVFCINDNKEQLLIAAYERHVGDYIKDNPAQEKQKQKVLQKVIKDLFFTTPLISIVFSKNIQSNLSPDAGIYFVTPDIPVPPPRYTA